MDREVPKNMQTQNEIKEIHQNTAPPVFLVGSFLRAAKLPSPLKIPNLAGLRAKSAMSAPKQHVVLIDLPTYPKGTVALSLYAVAAAFGDRYAISIVDLNFETVESAFAGWTSVAPALCGLKVSAQNLNHAKNLTAYLRTKFPNTKVLWGGELPTLLPVECQQSCDCIVQGAFEPVVAQLSEDLDKGNLQPNYQALGESLQVQSLPAPRLDLLPHPKRYPQFMGLPMESSRGCTYKCTFCMVHTMQPGYQIKTEAQLHLELKNYSGRFLNLIDYNFGVDPAHVVHVARAIGGSKVVGWMGEMCLESLDNEEVLQALAASRCRMVYCGLEAVDELGLKSINKARTNHIENYERIIRKVQAHGIQVAAGMIIGLEGASLEGFERMQAFFHRMGILYIKLTFLTYNPGTKVKESMKRKGEYVTEEIDQYDGNHLTFLATGLEKEVLFEGSRRFIRSFYGLGAIIGRSFKTKLGLLGRMEFVLFNLCYREFYFEWLRHDIFRDEEAYQKLLAAPFKPSWRMKLADRWLARVRKWRL
jgi:radical SAM superfamily enzyme YgiQ (UPF0313 family)